MNVLIVGWILKLNHNFKITKPSFALALNMVTTTHLTKEWKS